MERLEQLLSEKEVEDDGERELTGAGYYRAAEVAYQSTIRTIRMLGEGLHPSQRKNLINPLLLDSYELVDSLLSEMEELRQKYGLVVGGENGKYYFGNEHSFNPDTHLFEEEPGVKPPQKGDIVIVSMSEIGVTRGDTVEQILPASFTYPQPEKVIFSQSCSDLTLPSSRHIFTPFLEDTSSLQNEKRGV